MREIHFSRIMASGLEKQSLLSQDELIKKAEREGKEYRKTATTRARPLTEKDFKNRGGVIQTKEGPVAFRVGDYLAVGIEGEEWPISKDTMERTRKIKTTETGKDGVVWGVYVNTNKVRAVQINAAFSVTLKNGSLINGNAGDYFVYDGQSCWITAQNIFEHSYALAEK